MIKLSHRLLFLIKIKYNYLIEGVVRFLQNLFIGKNKNNGHLLIKLLNNTKVKLNLFRWVKGLFKKPKVKFKSFKKKKSDSTKLDSTKLTTVTLVLSTPLIAIPLLKSKTSSASTTPVRPGIDSTALPDNYPKQKMISPTHTGTISSKFGYRNIGIGSKYHKGIDIAAPIGTPVYAVMPGKVIQARWEPGYGNYVKIDHGDYITVYAHLHRINVKVGDNVSKGTVIGEVGNTGTSTGSHLHFETIEKTASGNIHRNPEFIYSSMGQSFTPKKTTIEVRAHHNNKNNQQ